MRSDFGEQKSFRYRGTKKFPIPGNKKVSDTGTRTRVSCVRGKYANHLHHIGRVHHIRYCCNIQYLFKIPFWKYSKWLTFINYFDSTWSIAYTHTQWSHWSLALTTIRTIYLLTCHKTYSSATIPMSYVSTTLGIFFCYARRVGIPSKNANPIHGSAKSELSTKRAASIQPPPPSPPPHDSFL